MRCKIALLILFFSLPFSLRAQTKAELENQRIKTLSDITYVDNLLKTTAKQKTESIHAISIIGRKLTLRERVIKGMGDEIALLNERIELNNLAVSLMEEDLIDLKSDYAKAVINSYKTQKGNPELVYILSARDFNQGYKRLKYLQQITKYRRKEAEVIVELKDQIESAKVRLQKDLDRISDLKSNEEQQKDLLQKEQGRKQQMVKTLSSKEKQLRKELDDKKRIAKKIEAEIARMIEEERRKAIKKENTPEQILIGENFAENKGRLPWPVEKGILTSQFGVQKHPVLKNVTENNIGVEFTSSGNTIARTVFQGEVARVFPINGANMTVIIRHGKYLSVYSNIINVKVRPGDKVITKQQIGEVYTDPANNNNSVMKFMITLEMKYEDPEQWIAK